MEKEGKFKVKKNIFLPDCFMDKLSRINKHAEYLGDKETESAHRRKILEIRRRNAARMRAVYEQKRKLK